MVYVVVVDYVVVEGVGDCGYLVWVYFVVDDLWFLIDGVYCYDVGFFGVDDWGVGIYFEYVDVCDGDCFILLVCWWGFFFLSG